MNDSYEDIINLDHHVSSTRKPMSLYNRAAQFAPFAALAGFEQAIQRTRQSVEETPTDSRRHDGRFCR